MAVTGGPGATVQVSVPVPTPVAPAKPKPPQTTGISWGGQPQQQPAPGLQTGGPSQGGADLPVRPVRTTPPRPTSIIFPWNPAPKRLKRKRFTKRPSLVNPDRFFPEEQAVYDAGRVGEPSAEPVVPLKERVEQGVRQGVAERTGVYPKVSEIAGLATLGQAAKGGYKEQHEAVTHLLGNPDDANRWATLNAILSANSSWHNHTANAFEALAKWHAAGRPRDPAGLERVFGRTGPGKRPADVTRVTRGEFQGRGVVTGDRIEKIKKVLAQENYPRVNWSDVAKGSFKTPNFAKAFSDPRGTALDTHMARLLTPGGRYGPANLAKIGLGTASRKVAGGLKKIRDRLITQPHAHLAYKTLIGHAAHQLGWEPREVQEAVWAAVVAVMAAKHARPGATVENLIGKLNYQDVRAGWSLHQILSDQRVINDLKDLKVPDEQIRAVALRSRKHAAVQKRVEVGREHRPGLETAVARLPGSNKGAAKPVAELLRGRLSRRRVAQEAGRLAAAEETRSVTTV